MDFENPGKIYAPMLSLNGNLEYSKTICSSLWSLLYRISSYAKTHKIDLIASGKDSKLDFIGNVKYDHPLTFFIYHVPVENTTDSIISSFDILKFDMNNPNRSKLVRMCIKSILRSNPQAQIVLITDEEYSKEFLDLNVSFLKPKVDKSRPMYFRVKTYNTLIQSSITEGKIILLDSDLLVLKSFLNLDKKFIFDIALTRRYSPTLMPINEGMIIINNINQAVKEFFAQYIAVYDWLRNDSKITKLVGVDLMKWRGGQLSLNAICPGIKNTTFMDSNKSIMILPSDKYNHNPPSLSAIRDAIAKESIYACHLKGRVKDNISNLNEIENILF